MKILKIILICLLISNISYAKKLKTPSDVYSYALMLKSKVEYLRKISGIRKPFPTVDKQSNKYPRHVIQKSLEILSKINLYRIAKGYGEIFIPPYPARDITPSDVYDSVKRLDEEVTPFIKDKKFLNSLKLIKFKDKTPNDVYRLLWSISIAFDSLLGVHGYTPTDVYSLSQKLVETAKFLRESQNIYSQVVKPEKIEGLHPNHALYKSYDLLKKISESEKKLWIEPTEVPNKPHKVISSTDVYDSLQYNIAELQRIKYRLGLERYFKLQPVQGSKSPSDVVQNIEYATMLMPTFDFNYNLIQYPQSSLLKTPNDVYAVAVEILRKLEKLKYIKGISQRAKIPPYISGLKPIHTYQKVIEAIEKSIRLKTQMGFYPSQVPTTPLREITPNEVYELVLRLDGITTILLKKAGNNTEEEFIYKTNKHLYTKKVPSDVYNKIWQISNLLDVLLAKEYTPNETFFLSTKIKHKISLILQKLNVKYTKKELTTTKTKTPADVFKLTLKLFNIIKKVQNRMNMQTVEIIIPKEDIITPNTVYNALRIVNASINQILINMNIDENEIIFQRKFPENKTPSDVFNLITQTYDMVESLFQNINYE